MPHLISLIVRAFRWHDIYHQSLNRLTVSTNNSSMARKWSQKFLSGYRYRSGRKDVGLGHGTFNELPRTGTYESYISLIRYFYKQSERPLFIGRIQHDE